MRTANGFDEFYSRTKSGDSCELFLNKYLDLTIDYPHVHIVHHGHGDVDIIASISRENHIWRTSLKNPSGNEVDEAIRAAASKL
jgi:hypothetical protein